jgi:acetylornithine aminotransferase
VAALTTLDVIEQDGLVARAAQLGGRMRDALAAGLEGVPGVKEVRGKGLLLGIELDRPCGELVKRGFDAGLLINVTAENVVRLLPPLVITDAEAKQLVDGVIGLVRTFLQAAEPAVAAR